MGTGDKTKSFDLDGESWTPSWIVPGSGSAEHPRDVELNTYGDEQRREDASLSHEDLFYQLLELDRKEAVMGAGTKCEEGKTDNAADSNEGVVAGHAYTIKDVQAVESNGETFHLLQLRNPWGSFEFKGDWSDGICGNASRKAG